MMNLRKTKEESLEIMVKAQNAINSSLANLNKEISRILGYNVNVELVDRNGDGIRELYCYKQK